MKFCLLEVKFIGYIIIVEGLKLDFEKVKVVFDMLNLIDVVGVCWFIGFVIYLVKFFLKLSDICELFWKLI